MTASAPPSAPPAFAPPRVAVTLAVALVAHIVFWPIVMQDIGIDYVPWLAHIAKTGPVAAFAHPFAAYNTPYLYLLALVSPLYHAVNPVTLVKAISVAGTLALAGAMFRLLKTLAVPHAARWAALVVALPSVVLNGALLGQSDALWAAPCVCALEAALRRRHHTMLAWAGVAIAVKLQAIFFAPFVVALLLNRKVAIAHWFVVPAVFFAFLLPAWSAGWPMRDLLSIYAAQTVICSGLSLNTPNLWFVLEQVQPDARLFWSTPALAIATGAALAYVVHFARRLPITTPQLLGVALLSQLVTVGLLPHMHERYFFLADILALAWAIHAGTRHSLQVFFLVQAGSTLSVLAYATGAAWLVDIGFVAMAAATVLVLRATVQPGPASSPAPSRDSIASYG